MQGTGRYKGQHKKLSHEKEKGCSESRHLEVQCFSDNGLAAIGDGFPRLEKFTIFCCSNVTSMGLSSLANKCSFLKTLAIQGGCVGDHGLISVGKCCKKLEDLSLRSCQGLTDMGVVGLVGECPLLKNLKLEFVNITDEALMAVGACCFSLELLTLFFIRQCTDKGLIAIGEGCNKLKNLTLTADYVAVSDKSLEAIARGCGELTHLVLFGCDNIGTLGLEAIGNSCGFLQALHLVGCSRVDDDAICSIARSCTSLKELDIDRCHEIGNTGIKAIGEHCKSLAGLSIHSCNRVRDEALIAVGQGCSLQSLNVSNCPFIGNAGITAIARECPQLIKLDASALQNLGDVAMVELGEGCPLLKEIVLSGCLRITDVGIAHLVKGCTMLETCCIHRCPGITSVGVATLVSSCSGMKIVFVEKWKVSARTRRRAGSRISFLDL